MLLPPHELSYELGQGRMLYKSAVLGFFVGINQDLLFSCVGR